MDGEGPGSTRRTGKPEAMGSRDAALSGAFSSLQQQAHERQPWVVLLSCYGSLRGESLGRWLHPCEGLSNSALPPGPSGFPPKAFPVADVLPPVPSDHLPTINSSPHPRTALHSPRSSSSPRVHWWTCVQSRVHRPVADGRVALYADYRRSAASLSEPSNASLCPNRFPWNSGISPLTQLPTPRGASLVLLALLLLTSFILASHVRIHTVLSGDRGSCGMQPVFCENTLSAVQGRLWRQTHSMSTCSSANLDPAPNVL